MRTQRIMMATVALLFASHLLYAQTSVADSKNEVEVRGVYLFPSGETNFSGTNLSFSNDFNLPNRFGLDVRYTYRSTNGKHKIGLQYSHSGYESTVSLRRDIDFLFHHYTIGIDITSKRKLDYFGGAYAYRWGNEHFRIGPLFQVGLVRPSVKIDTVTNSGGVNSAKGSITKAAGLIGYDIDAYPVRQVNIFHNLGWIRFRNERLFSTEVGLRYYPAGHFGVSGGYKFVNYKLVSDGDFIRAREQGPYVGGVVRF